jgi:hypothetical protein
MLEKDRAHIVQRSAMIKQYDRLAAWLEDSMDLANGGSCIGSVM